MKRLRVRRTVVVAVCVLVAAVLLNPLTASGARAEIATIWQRARATGGYEFSADVVQTTIPLPGLANVGRSSKQQTLHIEGSTDFPKQTLELALWSEGGSLVDRSSATQVKVEGDQAYARRGDQAWQAIPDFTGAFAPDGDFLAYLSAAKNIVKQGSETRAGIPFTRYAFELDGRGFAAFVRDQLESRLAEQGKLPPGVQLDLPAQYKDMTGEGELWVRDDGLPLRQIIKARFPAQSDYRVEAEFTVDFSDYANVAQASNPQGTFGGLFGFLDFGQIGSTLGEFALSPRLASQALIIMLMASAAYLVIRHARSKRVYAALSVYLIVSMVVSPLLQSQQALAFTNEQREQAAVQEQQQQEQAAVQQAMDMLRDASNQFDPHVNPLDAAAQNDALTRRAAADAANLTGVGLLSDPVMAPSALQSVTPPCTDTSDSDNDGLTKCQEDLLGIDPNNADSDSDGLSDGQEVRGFSFGGKTWYTDPNKASTLDDTVPDGQRCPLNPSTNQRNCAVDTDGDGTPDVLDRDFDGDGVPNDVDLSPFRANATTFGEKNAFSLVINGLQQNKPTYVEFQIRPITSTHLTYAFNVLDWPSDKQGQVQRDPNSTVKTFFDVCVRDGSPQNCRMSPDDNGDIRLIPMLEIRVPGVNNLPSQDELNTFGGISLRPLDSGDRVAYVPLQVVNEPDSDARVAFYGKMLYRPGSTWGGAHQVRLVWLGRMLVGHSQELKGATCKSYVKDGVDYHNQIQTVFTYYDDFKLTALNVREDHGADFAIAYEDPSVDSDLNNDFALTALSNGLDVAFLTGRNCDSVINGSCVGDAKPDLTVSGRGVGAPTIAGRFDRLQNGGGSGGQR